MAMSFVIGRTSRTVVPLAVRAVTTSRVVTGSHVSKALSGEDHFVISNQYFSTAAQARKLADRKLREVLKSDIKSTKRLYSKSDIKVPQAPSNFPFEIEDIPGEDSITLMRELAGEEIEVVVGAARIPYTESSQDDQKELIVDIIVYIFKDDGKTFLTIETDANVHHIDVEFITLFVDPDTNEETRLQVHQSVYKDEDMKNAWKSYIAVRGIEEGIVGYLIEYMLAKSKRDKLHFLKKFSEVVKE